MGPAGSSNGVNRFLGAIPILRRMLTTLMSAAVVCAGSLVLGQGALRLFGWRTWSWLAPSVGLSLLMVVAVPAVHVPGRTATTAVVAVVLVAASAVLLVREPALRPPLGGLVAAAPVALLALVPFAVAGRSGTLGVSINNDTAFHLAQVESYISERIASADAVNAIAKAYPLGMHSLVAAIAGPLELPVDQVFAGAMIALPVMLAWTALGAVDRAGCVGQWFVATLAGMPFLVAAYYGEGAFKEVAQAMLVLACVLVLMDHRSVPTARRWIPFGVIVAGSLSVYSFTGVLWPAAILAASLTISSACNLASGRLGGVVRRAVSVEMLPLAIGVAVLLVLAVPQIPGMVNLYSSVYNSGGSSILDKGVMGNLVQRLPIWEAFGTWDNFDFRMPAVHPLTVGVWSGLLLLLVLAGVILSVRRGDWALPAGAVVCFIIWFYVDRTQSPYVSAKALVILSPFLALLAVRPLVERVSGSRGTTGWWAIAAPVVLVVLTAKAMGASWDALRHSPVGPRDHFKQLRDLRASLDGRPTLFLGNDDFVRFELAGVHVEAPFIGAPTLSTRPEKSWQYGQPFDFDSIAPAIYDAVDWVIVPRDAAGSARPHELRLVRSTRDFSLYRRVGRVQRRRLLQEGSSAAALLDCSTPEGRAIARMNGVAAVRRPDVTVVAPAISAGGDRTVSLPLGAGTWDLTTPYTSSLPVRVDAPGLQTMLPPNLDRPGPRLRIGRLRVARRRLVPIRLRVEGHRLSSTAAPFIPNSIVATRAGTERFIPLRRACGRYVDYYLSKTR